MLERARGHRSGPLCYLFVVEIFLEHINLLTQFTYKIELYVLKSSSSLTFSSIKFSQPTLN